MRRATSFRCSPPSGCRAGARGRNAPLIACLAFWGLGMLSPAIDRDRAIVVLIVGWGVILAAFLVLAVGTQRVAPPARRPGARRRRRARRGADPGVAPGRARSACARLLPVLDTDLHRRLALAPGGRLQGLPGTPTFSDFFYYSVSTGFISPPGDIIAASKGARTATMIELLTGTAALAAYLGSFLDFGTSPPRPSPPPARRRALASDLAGVVDLDVDLALTPSSATTSASSGTL